MATQFPMRARRDDPQNGYMVVQEMVEWLRDAFDKFTATVVAGTATVLNGNTSVVVPISAGTTYKVVITPLADPAGRFWVSSKSSSQFQINLSVAAPVAGVAFDWVAKGA